MKQAIPMVPKVDEAGHTTSETWPLPLDEAWLETLLRDIFENHWQQFSFGPMLQGGAYELRCPGPPKAIGVSGGYFTVHWGLGGHFHLCIGESSASPELIAHRRPSKVWLARGLDRHGHPVTWSLHVENGHGESTLSIYFPNPFLTDEDGLAESPDWSRLAVWHHVLSTYAGHQPDGRDMLGKGFGH